MPSPSDAPEKIREKVQRGDLPLIAPLRMWASFGTGNCCAGCDLPITSGQAEWEIEIVPEGGLTLLMHFDCASLLAEERRRRASS